jgi:phosphoribosyl 1,2-cyclic phosphodiesterase
LFFLKNLGVTMFGFCPLASGSKGNAVFFSSKETKILIDAGIGYNEIALRLEEINVKLSDIDAIFITHEHTDHIEGLKTILPKTEITVIANSETAKGIYGYLNFMPKFKIFTTDEPFEYKDLSICPFSIQHDTLDPVGYVIKTQGLKIGFCTDLGFATTLVKKNLSDCDYLYLESNHDLNMLFASKRPMSLKKRISGRQGHLSNEDSLNLLDAILHPGLKHIFLAHLSKECNSLELVENRVRDFLKMKNSTASVSVAHQDKVSDFVNFS